MTAPPSGSDILAFVIEQFSDADRLVARAFRRWVIGLERNAGVHWSFAWSDLACEFGPHDGKIAVSAVARLVRTLQRYGRRSIRYHMPCCPCLTGDELSIIALVGACQRGEWWLARSVAEWMVRPSGIDALIEAATPLAVVMRGHGLQFVRRHRTPLSSPAQRGWSGEQAAQQRHSSQKAEKGCCEETDRLYGNPVRSQRAEEHGWRAHRHHPDHSSGNDRGRHVEPGSQRGSGKLGLVTHLDKKEADKTDQESAPASHRQHAGGGGPLFPERPQGEQYERKTERPSQHIVRDEVAHPDSDRGGKRVIGERGKGYPPEYRRGPAKPEGQEEGKQLGFVTDFGKRNEERRKTKRFHITPQGSDGTGPMAWRPRPTRVRTPLPKVSPNRPVGRAMAETQHGQVC